MLENKLADFVNKHTFKSISEDEKHIIKRNILDSYAGICASLSDHDMLHKFDRLSTVAGNPGGTEVWGTNKKVRLDSALFMNCILGRRSDLVNTYLSPAGMGGSHPSDNVALVLTLAKHLHLGGKELLSSTHLAYLLSCSFADYYDPHINYFDHDSQAIMYIPLIIAYLMKLENKDMVQAQQIAGLMGLSIDQASYGEITDWRHCTYASNAMRAMQAVWMAQANFSGAVNIYEGKAGIDHFFKHAGLLLDPLPDLNTVIFKRWPALVFCQTPIDVALDLAHQLKKNDKIENIEVLTYKYAIQIAAAQDTYHPKCRAGKTHSIPYCISAALINNDMKYEYFNDDYPAEKNGINAMMQKISVTEDPEMTQGYPKEAACRIILHMEDGSRLESQRGYPKGDPHDPLSDPELKEKACSYIQAVAGDKTTSIIDRIWNLEKEENLNWLIKPLLKQ
jgi:2-methylcitrate dehydratase